MITRRIGKILRGNATPFQLFTACLLASMLAFMPGFAQAPGLIVVLLLLLIIINANLMLAALTGLVLKLLALLLTPVSFAAGRFLLDGPLQGLFQTMINAPVLALFGFEYYVTTGGLAIGLIVGSIVGLAMAKAIQAFRNKMAGLEKNSERYQRYTSKKWVKFLLFVFVGGGPGKKTYETLLERKIGNPVRPLGVVFAVLVVVLLVLLQMFASEPIVTMALREGLERANGATVDLESADLNLKENRLTMAGLAMADPNALDTDLFRAARLEANISGMNLLRKRLQLDRVQVTEASTGEKRRAPGELVGKQPGPVSEPPPIPDARTIEDYIRSAKKWKERLAQVRRWLEKISGPEADRKGEPGEREETLEERLAREIREKGYARVRASHLIEGAPTFTISELIAEKVRVAQLPDETLDITAYNLSTHPGLLGKAPEVSIKSSKETLGFHVKAAEFAPGGGNNLLNFSYRGLPVNQVAGELKIGGEAPLTGGTIDLAASGEWSTLGGVYVDLPLQATLHDTTLTIGGKPTKLDHFVLPIGLRGPLDNPRIMIDDKNLANALVKAGVSRATEELKGKAQEAISKEAGDKLPGEAKGILDGILGGRKKEEK